MDTNLFDFTHLTSETGGIFPRIFIYCQNHSTAAGKKADLPFGTVKNHPAVKVEQRPRISIKRSKNRTIRSEVLLYDRQSIPVAEFSAGKTGSIEVILSGKCK